LELELAAFELTLPLPAGTRLVVIDIRRQKPVYWQGCVASAAVAEVQRGSRAAAR
jgi:hypothetical protein